MAAAKAISMDAAIVSVLSENRMVFKNGTEGFTGWQHCFALLPGGFGKSSVQHRSGELQGGKGSTVTNLIGPLECDSPINFKVLPYQTLSMQGYVR